MDSELGGGGREARSMEFREEWEVEEFKIVLQTEKGSNFRGGKGGL